MQNSKKKSFPGVVTSLLAIIFLVGCNPQTPEADSETMMRENSPEDSRPRGGGREINLSDELQAEIDALVEVGDIEAARNLMKSSRQETSLE